MMDVYKFGGNIPVPIGTEANVGKVTMGGDISGTALTSKVEKIKNVLLGTIVMTNGYVIVGDGVDLESKTKDAAGIVDKSSAQTIAGNKKFDYNEDNCWHDKYEFGKEANNALASTVIAKALFAGSGTDGTQAVVNAFPGHILLSTTATGSRSSILHCQRKLSTGKNLKLKFKIKTGAAITHQLLESGIQLDGDNYLVFKFDTATDAANIYISSNNAAAGAVSIDSGVDLVAATDYLFEIEIDGSDQTFTMKINGDVIDLTGVGTIPNLATFRHYILVNNKAEAQDNTVALYYVETWNTK